MGHWWFLSRGHGKFTRRSAARDPEGPGLGWESKV